MLFRSDALEAATADALQDVAAQTMLTDGIANAYRQGSDRVAACNGVTRILGKSCETRSARPWLFSVSGKDWQSDHRLQEEVFGPLGIIVRVQDISEMRDIARTIEGQLVASSINEAASDFSVGDRVFHQKFGNGNIASIDGNKLTIDFDKAGQKRVLDSFVSVPK